MHTVSLFEAKTHLSSIIESLLSGKESEVVISRRGKPVVRLSPLEQSNIANRIGIAKGRFSIPDTIDSSNDQISSLFTGGAPEE